MTISQNVLAALIGVCQQTVGRALDPVLLVETKIRQALFPQEPEGPIPSNIYEESKKKARVFAEKAASRLRALRKALPGGRPAKRDPEKLAKLLGVAYKKDEDLAHVFGHFVFWFLNQLNPLFKRSSRSYVALSKLLDECWAPLSLRSDPVYDPIDLGLDLLDLI